MGPVAAARAGWDGWAGAPSPGSPLASRSRSCSSTAANLARSSSVSFSSGRIE